MTSRVDMLDFESLGLVLDKLQPLPSITFREPLNEAAPELLKIVKIMVREFDGFYGTKELMQRAKAAIAIAAGEGEDA